MGDLGSLRVKSHSVIRWAYLKLKVCFFVVEVVKSLAQTCESPLNTSSINLYLLFHNLPPSV